MALNTDTLITIDGEQYFRDTDLAASLQVTTATLRAWDKNGTGPTRLKIGRKVLYSLTEIDNWVQTKMIEEKTKQTKVMSSKNGLVTK